MTVEEKLDLILDEFCVFKDSQQFIIQTMQQLTQGQQQLEQGQQVLAQGYQELKQEMQGIKQEMQDLKQGQREIWLHLENKTDKNIQLLAENYLSLVDKLNASIKLQDCSVLFELKTTYLEDRVSKIEKDVAELKMK